MEEVTNISWNSLLSPDVHWSDDEWKCELKIYICNKEIEFNEEFFDLKSPSYVTHLVSWSVIVAGL